MVSDQLLYIAYRPDMQVYRYKSFIINSCRFSTKDRDLQLKSQNGRILVKRNVNIGNLNYFGVLTNITQLNYHVENSIILFNANQWDVYHKGDSKLTSLAFLWSISPAN